MPSYFDQFTAQWMPSVAVAREQTALQGFFNRYQPYMHSGADKGSRELAVFRICEFMRSQINSDNYAKRTRSGAFTPAIRTTRKTTGKLIRDCISQARIFELASRHYAADLLTLRHSTPQYWETLDKCRAQHTLALEAAADALDSYRDSTHLSDDNDRWLDKITDAIENTGIAVHTCPSCMVHHVTDDFPRVDEGGEQQYYCARCNDLGRIRRLTVPDELGYYVPTGDSYTVADVDEQQRVTETWQCSAHYINEQNLVYWPLHSVYVTAATYRMLRRSLSSSNEGADPDTVYGYHDGPNLGYIPTSFVNRQPLCLIGMELEVEVEDADDEDSYYVSDAARAVITKTKEFYPNYMKAEHDGSLTAGFEMITGYTGLDTHEKVIKALSELDVWKSMRSHNTSTCGLHVHLDRKEMSPLHCMKLQAFVNSAQNAELWKCVARRYDANYARFHVNHNWVQQTTRGFMALIRNQASRQGRSIQAVLKSPRTDCGAVIRMIQDQRYSALNWQNEHTVEFRMFKGSTKFNTIMACLEMAYAAWQFTRVTPVTRLSVEDFMAFICSPAHRKDTRHLRAYLHAKRYKPLFAQEVKQRPNDKRFTMVETAPRADTSEPYSILSPDELREHAVRIWPQEHARRLERRAAQEQENEWLRQQGLLTYGGTGTYPSQNMQSQMFYTIPQGTWVMSGGSGTAPASGSFGGGSGGSTT